MEIHGKRIRIFLRAGAATTAVVAVALLPQLSTAADPALIDPAALPRGADPAVVYMVGDTIGDGGRMVPATKRGEHQALWVVSGGYLVRDFNIGPRALTRLVYIGRAGDPRVVARSKGWMPVAVSASGRRVAVQRSSGSTDLRTVITVIPAEDGTSGRPPRAARGQPGRRHR